MAFYVCVNFFNTFKNGNKCVHMLLPLRYTKALASFLRFGRGKLFFIYFYRPLPFCLFKPWPLAFPAKPLAASVRAPTNAPLFPTLFDALLISFAA